MESNPVCNHLSDQQNGMMAKQKYDVSIMSMIIDWIGKHKVLSPTNHNCYIFQQNKYTNEKHLL